MSKVNLGAGAPKKGRQHIEAFLEMISPPRPKPQDAGKIVLNPKKMRGGGMVKKTGVRKMRGGGMVKKTGVRKMRGGGMVKNTGVRKRSK